MKKKLKLLSVLLIFSILLVACGKKEAVGSRNSSDWVKAYEKRINDDGNESVEDILWECKGDQSPTLKSCWHLFESEELCIDLYIGRELNDLPVAVELYFAMNQEMDVSAKITNARINSDIVAEDVYYWLDEKDNGKAVGTLHMTEWAEAINSQENQMISSLELDLAFMDDQQNSVLVEKQISLDFPEEYKYGYLVGPYMGAMAEEQLLFENEQLRVDLIAFGGDLNGYEMIFKLRATNKTDDYCPLHVEGIAINDYYFDAFLFNDGLEKRKTMYGDISCMNSTQKSLVITSNLFNIVSSINAVYCSNNFSFFSSMHTIL